MSNKHALSLATAILLTASALPAAAQDRPAGAKDPSSGATASLENGAEPSEGMEPKPESREWYGLPSVMVDTASVALVTTGALTFSFENQAPAVAILGGLAGYTVGAPIVHAANGEWVRAGASLGIRSVPWAVWGILREMDDDEDVGNWALAGGALTAMIIDDAMLARHDAPKRQAGLQVLPAVDVKNAGASLEVTGTF